MASISERSDRLAARIPKNASHPLPARQNLSPKGYHGGEQRLFKEVGMGARPVTEHVIRVPLTIVNVFLIVLPEGITMVDAGTRRSFTRVASAVRCLGRKPEEITDIVVTHLHADHTGGLAEARAATGARVWMHAADAQMVGAGRSRRPTRPAPGSVPGKLFGLFAGITSATIAPVAADGLVNDREEIPVAGGLLPVWTPGHTEGHVAYLWPGDGGVLFVGDAASHWSALGSSPIYEHYGRGLQSLRELGKLDFEVACFAHGRPIVGGAAAAFAKTWVAAPPHAGSAR
jgi:glyoxylase-like metal-dependent hydrolase (beta-lactamase superfamily II)